MPRDLWRRARDREAARKSRLLDADDLCSYEKHVRKHGPPSSSVREPIPEITEEILAKMIANIIAHGMDIE